MDKMHLALQIKFKNLSNIQIYSVLCKGLQKINNLKYIFLILVSDAKQIECFHFRKLKTIRKLSHGLSKNLLFESKRQVAKYWKKVNEICEAA